MGKHTQIEYARKLDPVIAMAMLESGKTLKAVGEHFGVSRQRVQQVAVKHGVKSALCLENKKAQRAAIRKALKTGEPITSVSSRLGASLPVVNALAVQMGMGRQAQNRKATFAAYKPFFARIKNGESIRSVACGDKAVSQNLTYYAAQLGIESKHGPHRDFSDRKRILKEVLALRLPMNETLDHLSKLVSKAEGKHTGGPSIRTWANMNGLWRNFKKGRASK